MNYIEVAFTCHKIEEWQQDLFINDLGAIGFDTFEEKDTGFSAFIPESNFNIIELETLLSQLSTEIDLSYEVINIAQKNWNKLWEENFPPLLVAGKCYVRATFHESKLDQYPIEIIVDPKMAFGTGHHQTTSLMMELLLEEDVQGKTVLDMGCGTGILGILASKLDANSIIAIDNDPICFDSTKENAALNKVENIQAVCGGSDSIPDEMFDLLIANINRNILMDQMEAYSRSVRKDGVLLISGFYEGEDFEILKTKATTCGFNYSTHKSRDRWVAARFIKN